MIDQTSYPLIKVENLPPVAVSAPQRYRFEIPGFEGYVPAKGKRTSAVNKCLTNVDALILIIDYFATLRNQSSPSIGDIRALARLWKTKGGVSLGSANSSECSSSSWVSWYFNMSYGHVGTNMRSVKSPQFGSVHCTATLPTYWYRASNGHYALTELGQNRVRELRVMKSRADRGQAAKNDYDDLVTKAIAKLPLSPTYQFASIKAPHLNPTMTITFSKDESENTIFKRILDAKNVTFFPTNLCSSKPDVCTNWKK